MIYLIVWNVIVFIIYGIDKFLARRHKHRIRERTLIILSYLLASLGAMLGMIVFNHKTSKTKFRILVPLSFFVNIITMIIIEKGV